MWGAGKGNYLNKYTLKEKSCFKEIILLNYKDKICVYLNNIILELVNNVHKLDIIYKRFYTLLFSWIIVE